MIKINLLNNRTSISWSSRKRRLLHIELLHLKRQLDKSHDIYYNDLKAYNRAAKKYEEVDGELAEVDGRKTILKAVGGKKGKKEMTVKDMKKTVTLMSEEERKTLIDELASLNVPLIK